MSKDSVLRALTRIVVALWNNASDTADVDEYIARCTDISSALNIISILITNGVLPLLPDEEEPEEPVNPDPHL